MFWTDWESRRSAREPCFLDDLRSISQDSSRDVHRAPSGWTSTHEAVPIVAVNNLD